MKKSKLIIAFVMVLFTFVLICNQVFAVEIFDSKTTDGIYKLSEDESSFDIPFMRLSQQRMEIDKTISQLGLFFSPSSIDVNSSLTGLQMYYSNDTVRINSEISNAIIFCAGNVVVNANVKNTLFVYGNGTVTIGENGNVEGNLICYSPKLEVNGKISGNILGTVNDVTINNVVNGKLNMNVTQLNFGENAKVNNGININTNNETLTIDESIATSNIDYIKSDSESFSQYLIRITSNTLTSIIIFLLILIFVKNDRITKLCDRLKGNSVLKNGVLGTVGILVILSFGIILLMVLLNLGIAAIVFSVASIIIFALLKNIIVGTFLVKLVEKKYSESKIRPNIILTSIATFLLLEILQNIPYIGTVISIIIFVISVGIIISILKKQENNPVVEVVEAK